MDRSFIISLILHVMAIVLVIFGLPHFHRVEPLMVAEMPVEVVDIAELTQLKKKVVKEAKKKIEPIKEKKQSAVTGEKKQVKEELPKPKEPPKEVIKVAEKIQEKKKPVEKKEPPKPPQEIKKKEIKKPDENKKDALDALFKDLDRMKAQEQKDKEKEKDDVKAVSDANREHVDRLTLSEKDALIYQIQKNWHYVPGSFDDVSVFKVMIEVNDQGEVQSVTLLDQSILGQNSGKACFDSIKRAIHRSSPLSLPMDKKQSWTDGVRVTVDPQHVQIF